MGRTAAGMQHECFIMMSVKLKSVIAPVEQDEDEDFRPVFVEIPKFETGILHTGNIDEKDKLRVWAI